MARKDALLKLHSRLVSRRKELLGTIEEQLGALRLDQGNGSGDELDVAAISMNSELTSQLAEHESRELSNIERAMLRLREGVYGNCEVCDKKIPIERLNALPYTTVCVACQRELETNPELREELEHRHEREMAGLNDEDEYEDQEERERETEEEEAEAEEPSRRVRRRGAPAKPAAPAVQAKAVPSPAKTAAKPAAKPSVSKTVVAKVVSKPVVKSVVKAVMSKAALAKSALAKAALAKSKTGSKTVSSKSASKPVSKAPVKASATKNGKHSKAKAGSRSR